MKIDHITKYNYNIMHESAYSFRVVRTLHCASQLSVWSHITSAENDIALMAPKLPYPSMYEYVFLNKHVCHVYYKDDYIVILIPRVLRILWKCSYAYPSIYLWG